MIFNYKLLLSSFCPTTESFYWSSISRGIIKEKEKTCIWGGTPKKPRKNKNLCIYSFIFKLQSSSKNSLFDAIYLLRCFFHCSKQFLDLSILMPLCFCCLFVSPLPHQQNGSPLRTFSWGNKNSSLGQDQVNRKGGAWGSCHFWSKTELLVRCGQVSS